MTAHLIDTHLLVPRSRSSAKVKVRYQGHVSQTMGVSGALVFHKHIWFFFFSSPEHNVLRGNYCDRSSSGVCPSIRLSVPPSICPSGNNFFKNLLLQNQKANLDKTWQECSLGEALQKLLKEFNSNKNSGCHGNKMAENGKNL